MGSSKRPMIGTPFEENTVIEGASPEQHNARGSQDDDHRHNRDDTSKRTTDKSRHHHETTKRRATGPRHNTKSIHTPDYNSGTDGGIPGQ